MFIVEATGVYSTPSTQLLSAAMNGTTTFSITTLSMTTFSIMTLSITTFSIIVIKKRHSA